MTSWRAGARGVQWAVVALVAYDSVLAAAAWRQPRPPVRGARRRTFRVLVAAHDEQHVIAGSVQDVLRSAEHLAEDGAGGRARVVVIADRCSDATAAVARAAGAEVVERTSGAEGKGAALAWYLDQEPVAADEAVVVLDADTRLPPDLLPVFADALDEGSEVLQANLDVSNPDDSPMTLAAALSYWSGNRMVQLARSNLGWSADLGGTGMCLTGRALAAAGGFSPAFAEDRDLALRVVRSGGRVRWLHTVRVLDEKPTDVSTAVRQRARWRNGDRDVRRRALLPLLRTGSPSALDHALRLVRPGRAVLVALAAPPALAALVTRSPVALSRSVWSATLVAQLLLPVAYLARDGVAARHLVRYPFVVALTALSLPVQVVAPRLRGRWVHTPHTGRLAPGTGTSSR